MPSRKPSSPVIDTSEDDASHGDALDLVEQAEAEAAEAEAVAAAARARARAIRLRNEAAAQKKAAEQNGPDAEPDGNDSDGNEPDDAEPVATDVESAGDEVDSSEPEKQTVEEPETPTAEASGEKARRGVSWPSGRFWKFLAAGVSIVLILMLLAASGFMFWHHRNALADQRRAAEFSAAARQGVVTLMSLDFNHAKEDVQRIIDSSTGQFKEDFQATADDFVKVAESSKAVTETTVNATAIDSMTDDSAVVLVAATSRVTNAAGAKQDPRNWRLSVTLNRDGDQMKLSKVEFVP
ncbi:hypothetical protein A5699_16120 [Mycobacterium sp. E802]|uniref:hypothetical protein n=1 Tax=Mycobacterium sp. E802 TaxID=1834152 RepID=UPI0007FDCDF1|nr:hypothetical protein [Mycobacterium sp. E802]OBG88804.1 hypothetical protein A5699_16120 [Mycobacterium sp. E802]